MCSRSHPCSPCMHASRDTYRCMWPNVHCFDLRLPTQVFIVNPKKNYCIKRLLFFNKKFLQQSPFFKRLDSASDGQSVAPHWLYTRGAQLFPCERGVDVTLVMPNVDGSYVT